MKQSGVQGSCGCFSRREAGVACQSAEGQGVATQRSPVSFHQRRLWFLINSIGTTIYNMVNAIRISGLIRGELIQRVIEEIVHRHESLRTTFHSQDGEPVQIIAPSLTIPLQRVDLSQMDHDAQDAKIRELVRKEARMPFDLATGPSSGLH